MPARIAERRVPRGQSGHGDITGTVQRTLNEVQRLQRHVRIDRAEPQVDFHDVAGRVDEAGIRVERAVEIDLPAAGRVGIGVQVDIGRGIGRSDVRVEVQVAGCGEVDHVDCVEDRRVAGEIAGDADIHRPLVSGNEVVADPDRFVDY